MVWQLINYHHYIFFFNCLHSCTFQTYPISFQSSFTISYLTFLELAILLLFFITVCILAIFLYLQCFLSIILLHFLAHFLNVCNIAWFLRLTAFSNQATGESGGRCLEGLSSDHCSLTPGMTALVPGVVSCVMPVNRSTVLPSIVKTTQIPSAFCTSVPRSRSSEVFFCRQILVVVENSALEMVTVV